jgi:UbiD family decarboxylase
MAQSGVALNFRDFVDELLAVGDAVTVTRPVEADLEVGALTRRVYETRAPAPLFTRISGGEAGFRILGAPAGLNGPAATRHGRIAAHFGLPRDSTPLQIVDRLTAVMHADPVPPVVVDDGPCKQNVWVGDDLDLRRFPVPLLHEGDGGRYLGTYGFHVVRTPDGRWTSWSISRSMLHGPTSLVGPAMPQQHLGMIHGMWAERGEPTPWAMVLGAPPAALATAGMPLPAEVDEDGYVGALTGEPVHVVVTETNGLHVPANAEIVLEGHISPDETAREGPMGEYHGYAFESSRHQPVFHVEAVTFRDDAILPVCAAGMPPEENHTIWGTMISATALDELRRAGLPVAMAWCSYEAAASWLVVSVDVAALARMRTTEAELVHRFADTLFASHAGWYVPKVVLIGDDADITDIDQVVWAMATRYRPGTEYCFPDAQGLPLVPFLTEQQRRAGVGGKSVTSCLWPEEFEGLRRGTPASFRHSYPEAVRRRVLDNWAADGFPAR